MAQGKKGTAQHGTASMYVLGCRERCCRDAWNAYYRACGKKRRAARRAA